MELPHQPNFIAGYRPSLRLLQGVTALVCLLCIVLTANLLVGRSPAPDRQAVIGSRAGQEEKTSDKQVSPSRLPRSLGTVAMNSLAQGLEADTIRYFEESTGRSFVTDLRTGRTTTLSDDSLPGFIRSWWLPGKSATLYAVNQNAVSEYRSYDFTAKTTAPVGTAFVSFATSPSGNEIAYAKNMDGALSVSVSRADGTEPRQLLASRVQSPELSWPKEDLVVFASKRPERSGTDLTGISPDGTLVPLMTNRDDLEYVWSRDGRNLLFSYFVPGNGVTLWYRNLATGAEFPLSLATGARKCAWHPAGVVITCGVPAKESLSGGVSSAMTATLDDIVTLDLASGSERRDYTSRPGLFLGVIDPLISSTGKYFVFTNLFDRIAYSLELTQ